MHPTIRNELEPQCLYVALFHLNDTVQWELYLHTSDNRGARYRVWGAPGRLVAHVRPCLGLLSTIGLVGCVKVARLDQNKECVLEAIFRDWSARLKEEHVMDSNDFIFRILSDLVAQDPSFRCHSIPALEAEIEDWAKAHVHGLEYAVLRRPVVASELCGL